LYPTADSFRLPDHSRIFVAHIPPRITSME
jgi:hypothetical protein